MKKRQSEGDAAIKEWEESIRQRELAEKRRVAPGWLDREEKLLQPTHASGHPSDGAHQSLLDRPLTEQANKDTAPAMEPRSEGVELDRAFGGLGTLQESKILPVSASENPPAVEDYRLTLSSIEYYSIWRSGKIE
ncbi:hypothetical protein FQN49_005544 [Arthroderma sp. PD_2]|nr:hypothetical protein FQN49_005544 [Arthroderma sp. PD_2]